MTKMSAQKGNAPEVAATEASNEKSQSINKGTIEMNSTVATTNKAITVPFHGAELYVVEHNGQPYTPMKPIVAAMGLDWKSQHKKVAANQARWGALELRTPSTMVDSTTVGSADGKSRELTCIPVRKVAAWLTTIEPGKVKNLEVRARVIQYQNECDDALWQYWNDGVAVNPRTAFAVNPGDKLTAEEAETLRLMLKAAVERLPKEKQGAAMMQGWAKLKAHFKVSYREIPRHEFSEAVSIIARHTAEWVGGDGADVGMSISIPLEDMGDKGKVAKYLVAMRKKAERHLEVIDKHMADWGLVDEVPAPKPSTNDAVRMDWAFTLASQAAAKVQRAVFNCVMNGGEDWKMKRYLLRFDPNSIEDEMMAKASQIESNACIAPVEHFHAVIDDSICVDAQTLSQLASTCMTRLSRMAQSNTRALTS